MSLMPKGQCTTLAKAYKTQAWVKYTTLVNALGHDIRPKFRTECNYQRRLGW